MYQLGFKLLVATFALITQCVYAIPLELAVGLPLHQQIYMVLTVFISYKGLNVTVTVNVTSGWTAYSIPFDPLILQGFPHGMSCR